MKKIIYQTMCYTDVYQPETDELKKEELLVTVTKPYSEANEEIARREAYLGEYEIFDDGLPEPEAPVAPGAADVWDELDAAYQAGYQEGVDSI